MSILKEDSDEFKIFDLVMMYFFASLTKNGKYKSVTTDFEVNGKIFKETHLQMIEKGFTDFIGPDALSLEVMTFKDYSFKTNETYKIKERFVKEWQTAPKQIMSESELIQKMELGRIGTDGTIPILIKKIINRGYVEVNDINGIRRLAPTSMGEILAEGYLEIDKGLITPEVRVFIEKWCNKISDYKKDKDSVINKMIHIFNEKLKNLIKNFSVIEKKFKNLHKTIKEKKMLMKEIKENEKNRVGDKYVLQYHEI